MAKIDATGNFHETCTEIGITTNKSGSKIRLEFDVGCSANGASVTFTAEEFRRFMVLCAKLKVPSPPPSTLIHQEIRVLDSEVV